MSDVITTDEMIGIILGQKESQFFDCKRARIDPAKALETVVAFANADGGTFVFGLEDPAKAQGTARLIGVSEKSQNIDDLINLIPKEIVPPLANIKQEEIPIKNVRGEDDRLLVLKIERSSEVHSLRRGDTFLRRGASTRKLTAQEIIRLKYAKGSVHFESEPVDVLWDDLDSDLVARFQQDNKSTNTDKMQFFKDNGLAVIHDGKVTLNKAAVLLFGKNPSVSLKFKCGIKVSHYLGTEPNFSGEPNFLRRPFTIEGPLIRQIQEALKYLETWLVNPPKLKGASFKNSVKYPSWVMQEAVTNAVIHRDFSIQNDIQIRIFDNRIEVESPGILPGQVTVTNIRHERFARNPIILRTLNRFGEDAPNLDIGEGVDRMFNMMKGANLYDPVYWSDDLSENAVTVILFNFERVSYWDAVSRYLDEHLRITNGEVRKITGIKDTLKASRLLKQWTKQKLLEEAQGVAKKSKYYHKPGVKPEARLFS